MTLGARGGYRDEEGYELHDTSRFLGVARDISPVGTHPGHISLDLAKQSEHLNFKYGVYDLTPSMQRPHPLDDPRQTARDARELVRGRIYPCRTSIYPDLPCKPRIGQFPRGNIFLARSPFDALLLYLFPRDPPGFLGSSCG